jgi:hypothetical protein
MRTKIEGVENAVMKKTSESRRRKGRGLGEYCIIRSSMDSPFLQILLK